MKRTIFDIVLFVVIAYCVSGKNDVVFVRVKKKGIIRG